MKKLLLSTAILSSLTLLTACGGGGSTPAATTTPAAAQATYTVKGTVPGTLIEGFCDNGSYYKTNSDQTAPLPHPFSIKLPSGHVCNLVMTMDEGTTNAVVTSIGTADANGNISTRIEAAENETIDLGDIPLQSGTNLVNDIDGDGVIDSPLDIGTVQKLTVKPAATATTPTAATTPSTSRLDVDGDGVLNKYDSNYASYDPTVTDTDKDGIPDTDDINPTNSTTASNTFDSKRDANGDGYLDTDKNDDGFSDNDTNHDGKIDNGETGS